MLIKPILSLSELGRSLVMHVHWPTVRTTGAFIVALVVLMGGIVAIWAAFGLPRVAWSTDIKETKGEIQEVEQILGYEIDQLEVSQVRLAIEFNREKSLNLFQRALLVREKIDEHKSQPPSQQNAAYLRQLEGKVIQLDRELELTDERVIQLERKALELESNGSVSPND